MCDSQTADLQRAIGFTDEQCVVTKNIGKRSIRSAREDDDKLVLCYVAMFWSAYDKEPQRALQSHKNYTKTEISDERYAYARVSVPIGDIVVAGTDVAETNTRMQNILQGYKDAGVYVANLLDAFNWISPYSTILSYVSEYQKINNIQQCWRVLPTIKTVSQALSDMVQIVYPKVNIYKTFLDQMSEEKDENFVVVVPRVLYPDLLQQQYDTIQSECQEFFSCMNSWTHFKTRKDIVGENEIMRQWNTLVWSPEKRKMMLRTVFYENVNLTVALYKKFEAALLSIAPNVFAQQGAGSKRSAAEVEVDIYSASSSQSPPRKQARRLGTSSSASTAAAAAASSSSSSSSSLTTPPSPLKQDDGAVDILQEFNEALLKPSKISDGESDVEVEQRIQPVAEVPTLQLTVPPPPVRRRIPLPNAFTQPSQQPLQQPSQQLLQQPNKASALPPRRTQPPRPSLPAAM